ncbi:molybdopterin oxidoreductase family protein [Streptomyces europaeiscabiei]|uniref:Molybdopterin oxidoreductase family protein n=1 Tax=Streptomyces europaeiscabiei TaxID=146819 RepID=A0ABU4N9C5_9ACTN|nr:molybdopterin oxidoreductase family protein [Streptomyces europaeiscabiei]MDX2523858.1 molybdopterin oxidoreductase family protein [Streptomyces europaeiscabiei]MDX2759432.1 molybdopterin oxidoreductase family protein [Streptomyces europaeiscabiei]MDX3541095.1 molybdopterin oxidoreductase family protein [Streptomyces europaeiscabiei]MDX3551437.1 molybdopterin oxidoreductase family protein [Streptomyces europaeiscabiei]MDX3666596.1 molybdopterin oxidoreductase family protein [Streptomyces eu
MQNSATPTHCPYCALQCGMNLTPGADGSDGVVVVTERADFPVNRGALCGKGRTAPAVLSSRVRLTGPLVRRAGVLEPASWDEALDRIAEGLTRTRTEHGPDACGVFGGGGLTNEKAYALGKFARVVLGTSQIDYNGRFCMSSAAAAGMKAFGLDRGLPFPLEDIPKTGCVVLVGSNLAETMPPALRYLTELRENGGKLIVIDPRRTRTAEQADLHLSPRPGSDLALALGLLHLIVAEGRTDEEYIRERTSGWEEARAAAMAHWPEYVERITGVSVPELREAVRLFCEPEHAIVLTARGPEQQSKGTDTVGAWINLTLATGRAGRPLSGYGCLTGQGNGQGGREHGQKADQLPGYRKLVDPEARRHVAEVWGVDPDSLPGPGRSAYELLDALGGDIKSLLLMGSNPVVSAPRAAHIEERIKSLDFLAVCDVVLSETAALADVVLPVTQWAEETGTTTNLEGRVLLRRQAITPPDGVRSDLEVMHELADRLGVEKGFSTDPEEVFEELRRASAGGPADYSGITYRRLAEENGVFWPCPAPATTPATDVRPVPPTEAHPGTPRLFLDRFATEDGRARFVPVTHRAAAEEPDAEYPVLLTTGRVVAQYQSGAQTRRVDELNAAAPGPFVELHPRLAERLGAAEGDPLAVVSRRGRAVAPARITTAIRPDTVFMPFHWAGEGRANTLTNPALDPTSRMPEFKTCAVRVETLGK